MEKKVSHRDDNSAHDTADRGMTSESDMFTIEATQDGAGRVIVMGRPSRKRASTFINIPISSELRDRLSEQVLGSLAMGTAALIEWALHELQREGVSIKVVSRD